MIDISNSFNTQQTIANSVTINGVGLHTGKEVNIKIWGSSPNIVPKKKFLIFTLKIVGSIFEIKKGIPPTIL